jgi:peptidyl-dipeptidase A
MPYARYFLARILQFQLHRAMCERSGWQGPLHECSIFGSEAAGELLWKIMRSGASQPWQDTLEAAIGTREFDASAMLQYFAPLSRWLDSENQDRQCGW